jgi:hypothetical protein
MVYKECTRHNRSSIRKFCKGSEVNLSLPDLHHWPLTLVLVILTGTLPLIRLLGLRTISDEVFRTFAIETVIGVASLLDLLNIWPWAKLLWLLQRYRRLILFLLLRWLGNQSADQGILLWRSWRYIRNQLILRGFNARRSSGDPSLLFGMVCCNTILLS